MTKKVCDMSEAERERNRAYNAAHAEEKRARDRAWYVAHKEERKTYISAHTEERRKYRRKYNAAHVNERKAHHAAHLEERKAYNAARFEERRECKRAYNAAHREERRKYIKAYTNKRLATDPTFKILYYMRRRLHLALFWKVKSAHTLELLGCTVEELCAHLEAQFQPGMTWDNYGFYGWHIDHIIPCAAFDLSDPEQQRACFHWSNLQPLWAIDNLSKGARKAARFLASRKEHGNG